MRRPTLKRRKKYRKLLPLQQLIVAKEMMSGKPFKNIVVDWNISHTTLHRLFKEHLEYKIVWREPREEA